jgi:hypothetical protein
MKDHIYEELFMYLGSMILSKNDNQLINWWGKKKMLWKLSSIWMEIVMTLHATWIQIQIDWTPIQQFDWKIILKKSYLCNLNSIQIQLKIN